MIKRLLTTCALLVLGFGASYYVWKSEPFHLGLDLSGGSHLVYEADTSTVTGDSGDAMEALRDVIERRVNIFGVSEPVVQVQGPGLISGSANQLIVDLPGVTDVDEAVRMIGETPLLEFKIESGIDFTNSIDEEGNITIDPDSLFTPTELTGRYLERAALEFDPTTREPYVSLQFDDEGARLFAEITRDNIGKTVAIYLDGELKSNPVVREAITGGEAVISGGFTPDEARELVKNLNYGALPVPITLISRQTIGATLGEDAIAAGVRAAIIGFIMVCAFLILWYRLPGLVAALALSIFVAIMLALFKLIPVTLTAAGIAGFIISMGIAVDANVLIFERLKEELRIGATIGDAMRVGFTRAWLSIRDSNFSGLIVAMILFWFGTSLIKGFALTLGIGILVSLFTAHTATRVFLSVLDFKESRAMRFLFSSGLGK